MEEQITSRVDSDSKLAPELAPSAKPRQCLMCHEQFPSEWAGERICKRCRQTAAWRQG